jgi:tripartite-type tricarboxylate transporter receptor subunit TctC
MRRKRRSFVSPLSAAVMAQWLSERLGQPFVIENRPGAARNIATEAVVNAPHHGYTAAVTLARPTRRRAA